MVPRHLWDSKGSMSNLLLSVPRSCNVHSLMTCTLRLDHPQNFSLIILRYLVVGMDRNGLYFLILKLNCSHNGSLSSLSHILTNPRTMSRIIRVSRLSFRLMYSLRDGGCPPTVSNRSLKVYPSFSNNRTSLSRSSPTRYCSLCLCFCHANQQSLPDLLMSPIQTFYGSEDETKLARRYSCTS